MIDLDEIAKKYYSWYLVSIFMPHSYWAETINDFLSNKNYIQATDKILPIGCFFNGLAGVMFGRFVIYTPIDDKKALLSDASSSLEVSIEKVRWGLNSQNRELLKPNMRLYEPVILYKPNDDYVLLSGFKTSPKLDKESDTVFGFFKELALAKQFF